MDLAFLEWINVWIIFWPLGLDQLQYFGFGPSFFLDTDSLLGLIFFGYRTWPSWMEQILLLEVDQPWTLDLAPVGWTPFWIPLLLLLVTFFFTFSLYSFSLLSSYWLHCLGTDNKLGEDVVTHTFPYHLLFYCTFTGNCYNITAYSDSTPLFTYSHSLKSYLISYWFISYLQF